LIALSLCLAGTMSHAADPAAVAVLPFTPLRQPETDAWFGRFVQAVLRDSLLKARLAAVMPPATAERWQQKLRLAPLGPLPDDALTRMNVGTVIRGSTRTVLGLTRVTVHVVTAEGSRTPADGLVLQWRLEGTSPDAVAEALVAEVLPLISADTAAPPQQPPAWAMARAFYGLPLEPVAPADPGAAQVLHTQYGQWSGTPGLSAKAHGALALLALQRAAAPGALETTAEAARAQAQEHAEAARQAEPWHPDWAALAGEVYLLRKNYFAARAAANEARLRNPLDGLALVVLAGEAGLSSGEGRQHMVRALLREPFLQQDALPDPQRPFQGGVLHEMMVSWSRLRAAHRQPSARYLALMDAAQDAMDAENWQEAEKLLVQAAGSDDADHMPRLLLAEILVANGQPGPAARRLRELAAEFPQEAEVHFQLGVALARSDEPRGAGEAFARALVENPERQDARFALAQAYMAQERWQQAVEPLRTLLLRDSRHAEGWLHLGITYTQLQQWDPAEGALRQALSLNPQSAEARDWLQRLHAERKRMQALEQQPAVTPDTGGE
jgi:Tfp pilus assembly protein PilF